MHIGTVSVAVRHDDAIVRDHRVHGVRILPGVSYLDLAYRAAARVGRDMETLVLRDIVFRSPVALAGADRRIALRTDGPHLVVATASSGTDEEVARCILADADQALGRPPGLDRAAIVSARGGAPVDHLYAAVRRHGIEHRDFMRARGTVATAPDGAIVAELSLGPAAARRATDFLLHPVFLDAATIAAFAGDDLDSAYLPMFIGEFRAWAGTGSTVYVRVTRTGSRTGDVLRAGIVLYDADARPVAEFRDLVVKRVRSEELIQRLAAPVEPTAAGPVVEPVASGRPVAEAAAVVAEAAAAAARWNGSDAGDRARIEAELAALVAGSLGLEAQRLDRHAGFYDLGLESSQLLALTRTLETRVGRPLYPTLLFEHQSIAALADYFHGEFGAGFPAAGASPVEAPAPDAVMTFGFDWHPPGPVRVGSDDPITTVVLFDDGSLPVRAPAGVRVVRVLRSSGYRRDADTYRVDPAEPDTYDRLASDLRGDGVVNALAAYAWSYRAAPTGSGFGADVHLPLRRLAERLERPGGPIDRILVLWPDAPSAAPAAAAVGGFARTLRLEQPRPQIRSVRLDAAAEEDLWRTLARESVVTEPDTEIRYLDGVRLVRRLTALPQPGRTGAGHGPRRGSAVLITGGTGGLGRLVARHFAVRYAARITLVGRRPPGADVDEFVAQLRNLGGAAHYVRADVADPEQAANAVTAARERFGPVNVIVHAAGVLRDGLVRGSDPLAGAAVLGPKIAPLDAIERAAGGDHLTHVVLFSSVSAVVGNPGQADYAAANRYLDGWAESRQRSPGGPRVVSVNWPIWAAGGMGVDAATADALSRTGLRPLPTDAGLEVLDGILAGDRTQVVVAWGDRSTLRASGAFGAGTAWAPSTVEPAPSTVEPAPSTVEPAPPDPPARSRIAVVGMSGRYPGAPDLDAFWHNLVTGRDCVTPVPPSRWTADDPRAGTSQLSRFGGFLDDVDAFDPLFFRLPPAGAALLDPQERLFLQSGYAAVENAGYQPADFTGPGSRVGVFVGVMSSDYRLLGVEAAARDPASGAVTSLPSSAANRLSYFFGFTGPSMTIDTACSSTLTALHLACRSIADGDCDAAVVGGVNLLLHPDKYRLLHQLNMTSSDGRCRSFGAGGDGYVPGEGVGALFLKPLDRALADGDTIHGVLVGSAVNHGGHSAGYTVPHPTAQSEVVRRALDRAGIGPEDVDYVEAHGTGTALGDPVEVAGLAGAFAGRTRPCPIGSVKANIGHLEAAAGIAAVTRVLLQMRHATLAPSLHSAELNPGIDFDRVPFYVPQTAAPWPRREGPDGSRSYRAGVSSFGAGGANAHVVIEEYRQRPLAPGPAGAELIVLSARTAERLRAYAAVMAAHLRRLDADGSADLGDVARTLQGGRPALPVRLAFVASSLGDAADLLERYAAGEPAGWTGEAAPGTDAAAAVESAYRAGELAAAARAWVAGASPRWTDCNGGPRRRIPLPGYPFARERYWIGTPPGAEATVFGSVRRQLDRELAPSTGEVRAGDAELASYAAAALHRQLTGMGLPRAGEAATAAAVRDRMAVRSGYDRFVDSCLDVLRRHGRIERRAGEWLVRVQPDDPAPLRAQVLSAHPHTGAYVDLLDACLAGYPAVLRGDRPATEVLFPGGRLDLTSAIYRGNPAYDFGTGMVTRASIAAAAALRPRSGVPVRVLEIGAGTGGTSTAALAAWAAAGVAVEYHYTDVGGGFVAHGRERFAARYPFTRFRVLDIERDPMSQGFPANGFDVVLAANALHAAADVDEALAHVRTLLAPGGLLMLAETTADVEVLALTFGLLEGWHRYRDPHLRIPHSPLLTAAGWLAALRRTGFGDAATFGPGLTADADPGQVLIVADAGTVDAGNAPSDAGKAPAGASVATGEASANWTGIEARIAAIVAGALAVGVDDIRLDVPVAEYGVDSILAASIVDRVNELFGADLSPVTLFDHPTVRALAAHVATVAPAPRADSPPAQPHPRSAVEVRRRPGAPAGVAIIGMSGRFAGADDLDEFWRNLAAGRDSVTEVPPDRWPVDEHFQPWPPAPGRTYSRWGGYLRGVDLFDPLFFRLTPAEADTMDPQQRLFLEESWRALEDAAIDPQRLRRTRCGVFVGAPASDYATAIRTSGLLGAPHVFTGNSAAILPARVAYHLDVTGPCVAVDTACSSSLVAVHQAVTALAAGDCDLAVVGGVSVFVTPEYHLLASAMGMLSRTGRCRAFDAGADGFVIGEGVGAAVLKPLDRALADGDPIHGVIAGIGVNQDGRTNGITAPSAQSQTELHLDVYERFGLDPATFGYVEAHGTGTRLGDPIEVAALTRAFGRYTDRRGWCPIGSVKTNVGHASHAAGMASLFKVLLSMRHGTIPPSLHCAEPNPLIDLAGGPFVVATDPRPWPAGTRRAAISSFGFSGTNAHLVVAGHPEPAPVSGPGPGAVLVPLSARTGESLAAAADRLAGHLAVHPGLALDDIARTLREGRTPMQRRAAVVARSTEELRTALARVARDEPAAGVHFGSVDPDAPPATRTPSPDEPAERLAHAWVRGEVSLAAGGEAQLAAGTGDRTGRRIHLPTYAFARERCWIPAGPEPPASPVPAPPAVDPVALARQRVLAAAADELGLPAGEIDLGVPSTRLGFDEGSRRRVVAALNREHGLDVPPTAFAAWASLSDLTAHLAGPAAAAPPAPPPLAAAPPAPPPLAGAGISGPMEAGLSNKTLASEYLKAKLAAACRLPPDSIRTRLPLQDYGIDSVVIASLNRELEAELGELPKTLFFEYQTIDELAGYLADHCADRLPGLPAGGGRASEEAGTERRPAPTPSTVEPLDRRPTAGVAVIGMAGRYPGARDHKELWRNLLAGRESIVEVPRERWDHGPFVGDDPDEPGTTYARWGGFIDGVDEFDARFFNIPPRDAETMDPQQRLFLQASYAAVEDAGYTPQRLRRSAARRNRKDVGVFAGVTYGEYQALVNIPIAGYWAVANRVSYHLGFNGPSLAVDTACSASLTAIHLACESVLRGEAEYAIAGGVNVSIHPGKFLLLGYGRWASTDGRCRSFGAGGDGYVPGEGVVALLLKPLADARADGDRIYGVILGSEVNHGGRTNGFTVPNPNAQADLIEAALARAGVDPRALSYVEAHGTGTSLGDPIEIAALSRAYRRHTADAGYCAIGSLKSNVGHLEAAAGAAGVVKTLLQLEHDTIVASLHAEPPNPNIDFAGSPFRVAASAQPWPRQPGSPRLAGVSSFGAGGANAHVILSDEPEPAPPAPVEGRPCLVVVSARQADRLRALVGNLVTWLRSARGVRLDDVAHTLMVGREAFEHRLAAVVASPDELAAALDRHLETGDGAVHTGIARTHADLDTVPGESDADRDRARSLARAGRLGDLAKLWTQGWSIDWEDAFGRPPGRVVSLPTYPFAPTRYWIEPSQYVRAAEPAPPPTQAPPTQAPPQIPAPPQAQAQLKAPASIADGTDPRERLEAEITGIFADLTGLTIDELDPRSPFDDFGFDSVSTIRMVNRLMKRYGVRVPAAAIDEHPTIRRFAAYLVETGLVTSGNLNAEPPRAARAPAAASIEPVRRAEPFAADRILMTGVTGVLGGKVLHDILTGTGATVHCLVRGRSPDAARDRVAYFLRTYDPQGELADAFAERVRVVVGDVAADGLGLEPATYERLAAETDVTIHGASRTTLVSFYDALAPINVEGTRRMVDFALRTPNRYLVYVSSFSALGDRLNFNHPPFTERDLELGQGYDHLPYQETKYEAEKLVRAASERGLLWNIMRPGNIMGDGRTGRYPFAEVSVKGVYYDILKTAVETGVTMLSPVHWDISPVDYVSAGLIHLGLRRPSYRETYHLTNPDIRRYYDVMGCLRDAGYEVTYLPVEEFHRRASQRLVHRVGSDEPYESQTIEMFKYGVEIFGQVHYEESSYPDSTYTRSILTPAGIECPTVADLLAVYVKHCVEIGYLPPPGEVHR